MGDLIHIDDIESDADATKPEEGVVPQELRDDPDIGDGSTSHEGFNIASWRLHVLRKDSLVGMTEYGGNDRISRNARRAQKASREARTAEERAARKQKRLRVGVVAVLVFVVVAAAGATYAMELWGGRSVPNVQGFTQANAAELIEEKGFEVEFQAAPSDSLEGHVVDVSPAAGSRVREGSTITLTIGEKRELPDVVGMTEDEAKAALEESGAANVRVEPIVLPDEKEGVVHEMRPEAGSVFISTEEVTLVVAHLPRVPDVTGLDEKAARKTMEEAGIPSHVTLERGTPEQRKKVIRTKPAANERIETNEEVTIVLGDTLIDPLRIEDYFDADLPKCRDFLVGEGFELKAAAKGADNRVVARFESANDAQISFLQKPWTKDAEGMKENADVLGGAKVEGVRLSVDVVRDTVALDAEDLGYGDSEGDYYYDETSYVQTASKGLELLGLEYASIDEETTRAVAATCGFGEAMGSCTQDSIKLPDGVERSGHSFYCSYGESGTHMWAVLLSGDGEYAMEASRIVVMCAPKVLFDTANMDQSTDAICDYVAYMEEYA